MYLQRTLMLSYSTFIHSFIACDLLLCSGLNAISFSVLTTYVQYIHMYSINQHGVHDLKLRPFLLRARGLSSRFIDKLLCIVGEIDPSVRTIWTVHLLNDRRPSSVIKLKYTSSCSNLRFFYSPRLSEKAAKSRWSGIVDKVQSNL